MVAPRKRTPQMFMGAPTAPQATNPAGMFGAPLTRQEPKRNFDWASLAQGVGLGLLTGKNPGEGIAQGLTLAQQLGQGNREADRYQRREDREEQRYQTELAQAETEKATAAAEVEQFNTMIDGLDIPPEQKQFYKTMGPKAADYKNLFPQASTDAPTVKDFYEGGKVVQKQWDGTKWVKVGEGDRWKPEGDSAGIQIDTDGDGIPDVTIGGGGMKPPSASASAANVKGLLLSQGLEDIAKVDFSKVSPFKMALGQKATETGVIGEYGANLALNDDEKRLMGAQGAIQEAVISAVTGAAYNEQQKNNMRAKYVILPTDSATRRAEKTIAAAEFLAQQDRNSGYTRVPTKDAAPQGDDGYTIEEVQ